MATTTGDAKIRADSERNTRAEPPAVSGCIWVDVATGRLCGGQIAPGGVLLCARHHEAAERRDWRAP